MTFTRTYLNSNSLTMVIHNTGLILLTLLWMKNFLKSLSFSSRNKYNKALANFTLENYPIKIINNREERYLNMKYRDLSDYKVRGKPVSILTYGGRTEKIDK